MGHEPHPGWVLRHTGLAVPPGHPYGEPHERPLRSAPGDGARPLPPPLREDDPAHERLAQRVMMEAIYCERCGARFFDLGAYEDHPCVTRSR